MVDTGTRMLGLLLALAACAWPVLARYRRRPVIATLAVASAGWVLVVALVIVLERLGLPYRVRDSGLLLLIIAAITVPLVRLARLRPPACPFRPAAALFWLAAMAALFARTLTTTVPAAVFFLLGAGMCVVVAVRTGALRRGSHRTKNAEQRAAEQRAAGIDSERARAQRENLLMRLYTRCGGLTERGVRLVDLTGPGENIADVGLAYHRIEQYGDACILVPDPATWSEIVHLTPTGARTAVDLGAYRQHTTYRFERSYHVSGDQIWVGDNSVVINRSLLTNSLNRTRADHGEATAAALNALAVEVERSGSAEAAELFDEFNARAQETRPSRSVLRSLFRGIENALPAAHGLADIAAKLAPMFG